MYEELSIFESPDEHNGWSKSYDDMETEEEDRRRRGDESNGEVKMK